MTKKELAETLKYSSPNALYVITWNSILKKVFCPFKVLVVRNIGDLYCGEEVFVEEVKVDMELTTIYIIRGKAYYFYHFEILI